MSKLASFQFDQSFVIRSALYNGAPWFIAKDVAEVLGYAETAKALGHCRRSTVLVELNKINSLASATKWIPEGDVYRLVMRSNKPNAEHFQDWVVEEVLPTICKTGYYVHPNTQATPEANKSGMDRIAVVLRDLAGTILTLADELEQQHTVVNIIPKQSAPRQKILPSSESIFLTA